MVKYSKIAADIENVVGSIISKGKIREAYNLYKIAQVVESLEKFPPDAVQLAKELGITLTPENAAEIVSKYSDPSISAEMAREAIDMKSRAKSLALLAAMLANMFISSVEAGGKPITIQTNFGPQTYSAQEIKQLKKSDPKSFAILMNKYYEQQGTQTGLQEQKVLHEKKMEQMPKPGEDMKTVKNIEEKKDQFGNEARLITYEDGTKKLEGDILQGGVSLRKLLLDRGEILPD